MHPHCTVIELRQYTLHPGRRDELIALFDREFVETQEDAGMSVIGQFRDLDKPDRFVWLRGFADMDARARALAAFYDGPVWRAHSDAANATMLEFHDVRLLRPAPPAGGFALAGARAPVGATEIPPGLLVAAICPGDHTVASLLADGGGRLLGTFVTEPSPNNFPRLPVREGEQVFVAFTAFADPAAARRWRDEIALTLQHRLGVEPEMLLLSPTARSWLRA